MISGNTLLLGDSITVGYFPYLKVNGFKRCVAQVGKTSAWLLSQLSLSSFDNVQNVVLLIGTNDVGYVPTATTFQNIQKILALVPPGVRVALMTLPPFRGWQNFVSNFPAIEARRVAINLLLRTLPSVLLVPLDVLLADPADPTSLIPSADSGDHLHPRPSAVIGALESVVQGGPTPAPTSGRLWPWLFAAGAIGGIAWWKGRKS